MSDDLLLILAFTAIPTIIYFASKTGKLLASLDYLDDTIKKLSVAEIEIATLRDEVERLTRERDAAIKRHEDMEQIPLGLHEENNRLTEALKLALDLRMKKETNR